MLDRVKRRRKLFDANSNYADDARAMVREWDQLQARYEHLPVFKEMIRLLLPKVTLEAA